MTTTLPAGAVSVVRPGVGVQIICATTTEAMAVRRLLQAAVMDEDARMLLLREVHSDDAPEIESISILDASSGKTVLASRSECHIRCACASGNEKTWRFTTA